MDQVDAAVRPCEEFENVWTFVIGGIVPNHMDEALVGIAGLDLGQKLDVLSRMIT